MKSQSLIDNIILLQSYYKFLLLGKYLENQIKTKDISDKITDIKLKTWLKSYFNINSKIIKPLLISTFNNPDKKNLFGYLIELSSFRWVFNSLKEIMDWQPTIQNFLKKTLSDQYFALEQITKFIRNVLSHTTSTHINLKTDDFIKQKDFLIKNKKQKIHLKFLYSQYFKQREWSKDYWVDIQIDFSKIKNWQSLFDIISIHQMYLLAELCYNISQIIKTKIKT